MHTSLLQFFTVGCRGHELGWNSSGVRESNEGTLRLRRSHGCQPHVPPGVLPEHRLHGWKHLT
jgi:hypothetical protein